MLILRIKRNESLEIEGGIIIKFINSNRSTSIRLGISAPGEIKIGKPKNLTNEVESGENTG